MGKEGVKKRRGRGSEDVAQRNLRDTRAHHGVGADDDSEQGSSGDARGKYGVSGEGDSELSHALDINIEDSETGAVSVPRNYSSVDSQTRTRHDDDDEYTRDVPGCGTRAKVISSRDANTIGDGQMRADQRDRHHHHHHHHDSIKNRTSDGQITGSNRPVQSLSPNAHIPAESTCHDISSNDNVTYANYNARGPEDVRTWLSERGVHVTLVHATPEVPCLSAKHAAVAFGVPIQKVCDVCVYVCIHVCECMWIWKACGIYVCMYMHV
jgi:hypothetical protein